MSPIRKFLALALLILIALFTVWPTVISFSDGIVEEYDGMLIVWILNQTIQKIPHNILNIFQSYIFYPFSDSLAFSVLMIPSAILSYLPVKLTGSFVAASNFTIIFGQIATVLVVYFWLKDISENRLISFIGAVALILSKIRFNFLVHLQMWTMYWWLLPSWMFWRYFKYKRAKDLYLGFVLTGIVIWENVLPFYFVATILAALVVTNSTTFKKQLKHFVIGGIIAVVIAIPVILVYREVSITHGFVRTIRDAAHFSSGLDDLSNRSFSPVIFLLFGLSLFKLGRDKDVLNKNTKWMFIVFIMSFLFTLGPVMKWGGETVKLFGKIPIPLPYALFYYLVPGLNALRATSRWILLTVFSVVALFSYAFRNLNFQKRTLFSVIFLLLLLLDVNRIEKSYSVPADKDIPEVYQWLINSKYRSVLELPMYNWTDKVLKKNEYYRMYFSLFHRKKVVNGVSGFMPEETSELMNLSRKAGSMYQIASELSFFDPDIVIVHQDQQKALLGNTLSLCSFADSVAWQDDDTIVVELK
ncbi:hypothetical protein JXA63_04170 [Candidatus Woesebacteria bacterium]|nr:hypothetical protein [Candidatus Woesebacteria bacterium]